MVPVEPVSLSIAIATLFTTCIECFECFKAAKGFEQHFEVLLVKLEYQQERLLVWGDLAEVCNERRHNVNPISENENKRQDLTKRCLDSIHRLFKDTEILKTKYGVRAYTSAIDTAPHSGISSNALKRFRLRLGRHNQPPSVFEKTRWAIHDETKFQKLVQDIRDLIDCLMAEVPVSRELQEQKVQDDIASMVDDIQSLHLFKEACKDEYPKWWTAASAAIDASEVATQDYRLADEGLERLGRYDTFNHGGTSVGVQAPMIQTLFGATRYFNHNKQIFFILTESCRAQHSETACDQTNLGLMSFQQKYSCVAPGSARTRSAPGYRIAKYVDPGLFTYADLGTYFENQNALRANAVARGEGVPDDGGLYHVTAYIYCPPCACQIATALDICRYRDKKDLVDFVIRIDHRLETCCSASFSRVEGLVSVIDYIKEKEKSDTLLNWEVEVLEAIDREWVEQQVGDYTEEDHLASLPPTSQLARIASFHKKELSCAAIVILGEADYSIPMMGAPYFHLLEPGTLPRETSIFRNVPVRSQSDEWYWVREYMGTYTSRNPLPPKKPAPIGLNTDQTPESIQHGSKRPRSSTPDAEGP